MRRLAQACAGVIAPACAAVIPHAAAAPQAHAAPPAIVVTHDIPYGPDPAERLDLYAAPGLRGAPVVLIVHGGAYLFGDKAAIPFPTVATFLARHGAVVASVGYRLAPQADWPAGAEDVARATAFARRMAASWGGDPARIVLLGHSAGASHVANYLFDRRFQPAGGPEIAAAILVSGRYALRPDPLDANERNWETYFGADPHLWADREPEAHLAQAPRVPLLLVIAAHENRGLDQIGQALDRALCRSAWHCPTFLTVDGATHSSEMARVSVAGSPFSEHVLQVIAAAHG